MPALVLTLWLVSTLVWWAFAFTPLPSEPPGWLTAARHACFGSTEGGLPAAHGWMLLVLAPAAFLIAITVLWGAELGPSLGQAVRGRTGQAALIALTLVVVVEGAWVLRKVHAALAVAGWAEGVHDTAALSPDYPRQTEPAPDFSLVDQHGATVSLGQFKGRPVALTFVFAHCQTMCPLVVESLQQASRDAGSTPVLLVTLDPWRDTPNALDGIARQWRLSDDTHVLSSRSVPDVLRVIEAYGVTFTRDEKTGDIGHPGLVFLIDADGRLAYTFSNPPAAWVREGLRRLGPTHVLAG